MIFRLKERKILIYVVESLGNSINVNFILNSVELPKSRIMVIMSMVQITPSMEERFCMRNCCLRSGLVS